MGRKSLRLVRGAYKNRQLISAWPEVPSPMKDEHPPPRRDNSQGWSAHSESPAGWASKCPAGDLLVNSPLLSYPPGLLQMVISHMTGGFGRNQTPALPLCLHLSEVSPSLSPLHPFPADSALPPLSPSASNSFN